MCVPEQKPSIGRIVHYTVTSQDAVAISRRRATQIHTGNEVVVERVYPMIITRVWGDEPTSAVNGQVLLDGNDAHWVTSVTAGDGPGRFTWPQRD